MRDDPYHQPAWVSRYELFWRADGARNWHSLGQFVGNTDETTEIAHSFANDVVHSTLRAYEDEMFSAWDGTVDGTLAEKLTLPLLTRDPETQDIAVNFDPNLTKLLNECKYATHAHSPPSSTMCD